MNTRLKNALGGLYHFILGDRDGREKRLIRDLILIHKETGLLLIHKSEIPNWNVKKRKERGELISGMLTAIKHFVEFVLTNENSGGELQEIKHSNCVIKINTKSHTVLAAVLESGNDIPDDFDAALNDFHEELYDKYGSQFIAFTGDNGPLRIMGPDLRKFLEMHKLSVSSMMEADGI